MSSQARPNAAIRARSAPGMLLGAAGILGAFWAIAVAVVAHGVTSIVLMAPALATVALAFSTGLWLGGRGIEEVRATAESRRALAEAQQRLAAARQDRAQRQMRLLLEQVAPAAVLFDGDGRMVAWSRSFATIAEVPGETMATGTGIAELVRQQSADPNFRLPLDGLLSGAAGSATRRRSDGAEVGYAWMPLPDGSLLLTGTPVAAEARVAGALFAACAEEQRKRFRQLKAAIFVRDLGAARAQVAAMRKAAADFSLKALAAELTRLELQLAKGGEGIDPELRGLAAALESELSALGAEAA